MQISWNSQHFVFELTFDKDNFKNCLDCAKAAKFKTTGAPQWIWYTDKVKNVKLLRENKPTSGLTITPDARAQFELQCVEDDKKEAVMKYARDVKARLAGKPTEDERAAKRKEREAARAAKGLGPVVRKVKQAKGGAHVKVDIQYDALKHVPFVLPQPPQIQCIYCQAPVYFYEKLEPLPVCIWCEKTIADHQGPDEDNA